MTKCKLCGNAPQPLLLKKLYHQCVNCQLIWLDDKYLLSPQREKQRYLEHNNDPENLGYVMMFENFLAVLDPWCRGGQALDFGSGPGPVLAGILQERGWDVDLYDPFFAPDRNFQYLKYDLITSTEVMEHIANPLATWKLLRDCLKPGGVLAVMTHFHPGATGLKDWWYLRDQTHICFYNRKTMAWLADFLGLSIVYCDDKKTTVFMLK